MKQSLSMGLCVAAVLAIAGMARAAITVDQLLPQSPTPVAGNWYLSDVRPGGTASIVDLAGLGGNLENNQPLPTGAAQLTTNMTNAAKAEVGTFGDFGLASTSLSSIVLGYDYYKQSVSGGNAFAAPSIKLQISAAGGTGDNYGSLVYEPSWNVGAGSVAVPTDVWTSVSINSTTGAGATGYGGWWWDGGFGQPNGAGGPPCRSLEEWITAFQTTDPTDFANAHIVGVSIGVGTYNQGQTGYFDNVSISIPTGNVNAVYDFGPAAAVPEPAAIVVWSLLGLVAVGFAGWRSKRAA